MRYLIPLALGAMIASCTSSQDFMTRYHEDGRAKPVIAVASMIDTTSFEAPWSLSDELTTSLIQQMGHTGKVFVVTTEQDAVADNPFSQDLSWMKRDYANHEFVAFFELVEHEFSPVAKFKHTTLPQEASCNLNMAIRLRVVDLRGHTPSVVLQEMVRDSYFIPKTLLPTDYHAASWGTSDFQKTPMGIAHKQLIQEVASRIKDYVLLAKSR